MLFMGEEVLTLDELMRFMNCKQDKIRRMVADGKLPKPVRAGRKNVWFKSSLAVSVAAMRKASSDNINKRAFT